MPRGSSLNGPLLERSFTDAMLTGRPMNVLLGIIALTGTIAAICGYGLNRRAQARRREEDQAVAEAEARREAENLELVIERLDALHRQTGFNVSASRAEIQKTLERLRRTDPSADR
jgi:beta-phosphoglucomutase-like phosphatase (HAD superfamily)